MGMNQAVKNIICRNCQMKKSDMKEILQRKKRMMKHKQRGLTLIELMMTTAIIGILLSAALPSYDQYRHRVAFSEALLAVSAYQTEIAIAANSGRLNNVDDIHEGQNGIPDKQQRSEFVHGIHVHKGEIKVTWKDDNSPLDNVNFTLTAQNFIPPIRWEIGGNCINKGYC